MWPCFALAEYFRQAVTTTARFRLRGSVGDFGVSHIKVDGQIEIAYKKLGFGANRPTLYFSAFGAAHNAY